MRRRVEQQATGSPASAMPVEAQMLRDPSQPRIKALDRCQLIQTSQGAKECLLGEFFRIGSLANARLAERHQTRKRSARKSPLSCAVTRHSPADYRRVVDRHQESMPSSLCSGSPLDRSGEKVAVCVCLHRR